MSNAHYRMLIRRRISRRNHIRIALKLESTITRRELSAAAADVRAVLIAL